MNVGPKPDGTIQPEFKERLAEMGKWLRINGEAFYGTRGGPVPPQECGVSTQKNVISYIHVLDISDNVIAIPDIKRVNEMTLLDGTRVEYEKTKSGITITLPEKGRDPYDIIIVVK